MNKFLLIGISALFCAPSCARADLKFTLQITGSEAADTQNLGDNKYFCKGDRIRVERGEGKNFTAVLMMADGKKIQINPTQRTFKFLTPRNAGEDGTLTVSHVQNLGFQTLRGKKVPHWRVNFAGMSDFVTRNGMPPGAEVWGSGIPFRSDPKAPSLQLNKISVGAIAMGLDFMTTKKERRNLNEVFSSVPSRLRIIFDEDQTWTFDSKAISTETLPANLFTVPSGYRRVKG